MFRNLYVTGFNLESILMVLLRLAVVLFAISFHELSHGFVAYKLGDNTAKYDGRLSLNPLKHIDPFGALCMFFFGFGWARPVRVNPYYFKNIKRDTALVSLAGPVSNFILAYIGMFGSLYLCPLIPNGFAWHFTSVFFEIFIGCNIALGVFNLIPIPPLDGSKIFLSLLPKRIYFEIMRYERYGFIVLIIALYLGVIDPVLNFFTDIILKTLFFLAGGGF